jgi:hypothetical protein
MELIPILATIILMATISTFFLAIGAYVLYKIREKQGLKAEKMQPATIQAELITPEVVAEAIQQIEQAPARAPRVFERPNPPSYRPSMEPIFVQKRTVQPAPQPVQQRYAAAAEQQVQQKVEAPRPGPAPVQSKPSEQKFLKYTSEGYVSTKEDKKQQGAVKWR